MDRKRAAEIWAKLERHLIEKCGLPNGRMLEVNRPYLIRWIGGRLKADPVERRAAAVENVSPPLPAKIVTVKLREKWVDDKHFDMPTIQQGRITHGTEVGSTIHDTKLAAMLERSCSRRSGYDGDDSVGYD